METTDRRVTRAATRPRPRSSIPPSTSRSRAPEDDPRGETVTYTYDVTNLSADAPLDHVVVTDNKCSPISTTPVAKNNDDGDALFEKVGQDGTNPEEWVYTCDYVVGSDLSHINTTPNPDEIVNRGTVHADDEMGRDVTDFDDWTTNVVHQDLAIVKRQRIAGTGGTFSHNAITDAYVDDTIEYQIEVSIPSTGDTPIDITSFTDAECDGGVGTPSGDANHNNLLDTSETWTWTCSHKIGRTPTRGRRSGTPPRSRATISSTAPRSRVTTTSTRRSTR